MPRAVSADYALHLRLWSTRGSGSANPPYDLPLALPRQPLIERAEIDHHSPMRAVADLFRLVVRRHLELDALALDLDHLGVGADLVTDRGGGEMPDVDCGANRALARIEIGPDRIQRGVFHDQDHHGG